MTIAQGISKKVVIKQETAWGVAAAPTAGTSEELRRVSSDLNLTKDAYGSQEIRSDQQTAVHRHGMRKVDGSLKGELSPKSYAKPMASIVRRDFAPGASVTGALALNHLTGEISGTSFASLVKGTVARFTGFDVPKYNGRNFLITDATALKLEGLFVDGTEMDVDSAAAAGVVATVGGVTFVPSTGHTNHSFTIEQFYEDISQSERFDGVKFDSMDVNLPPTGMAEISFKMLGKNMVSSQTAYFQSPAAPADTNTLSAVNGLVFTLGKKLDLVTALQFSLKGGLTTEPVVGSNMAPAIFNGRVQVSGSASLLFKDGQARDAFLNESEVALYAVFPTDSAPDSDFLAFSLGTVKFDGSSKSDGEKGIVQTVPFTAIKGASSTIYIQDSTQG